MQQQPLFNLDEYTVEVSENPQQSMLAHYLGDEAAETVTQEIGGWTLRIPIEHTGTEYERLKSLLGTKVVNKLIDKFGGEVLYVPLNASARKRSRDKKIRLRVKELVKTGRVKREAVQQTAKEFDVSERHVRRIL